MASRVGSAGTAMVGFAFPPAPGATPPDDELVSQAGGCGGMGGCVAGFPAGAVVLPFPATVPAPTGTGMGVTGIGGMLFACGENIPGLEAGLYSGFDAGLG